MPGFIGIERESKRLQLSLLAAAFALLTLGNLAVLVVCFPAWYAQTRFEQDCVAATATITDVKGHTPDYFQTLGVTFAYTANGAMYTSSVPWVIQTHKVGGRLRVRYLPYDPVTVQVRGKEPLTTSPVMPLLFGTFFSLLTRGAWLRRADYSHGLADESSHPLEASMDVPAPMHPTQTSTFSLALSIDDLPLNALPTDK